MVDKKEEKSQFITTTSRWSDTIENVLQGIGEQCAGYKWMNMEDAKRASKRYNRFMYSLMTLSPFSGVMGILTFNEETWLQPMYIVIVVLSLITGEIRDYFEKEILLLNVNSSEYLSKINLQQLILSTPWGKFHK